MFSMLSDFPDPFKLSCSLGIDGRVEAAYKQVSITRGFQGKLGPKDAQVIEKRRDQSQLSGWKVCVMDTWRKAAAALPSYPLCHCSLTASWLSENPPSLTCERNQSYRLVQREIFLERLPASPRYAASGGIVQHSHSFLTAVREGNHKGENLNGTFHWLST